MCHVSRHGRLAQNQKLKGRRNPDTSSEGLHTPTKLFKKKKKTLNRNGMSLLTFPCNINYDEHVRNFLDVMRLHAENDNLCLGEFSKSLTDMAYLWYTTRPIKPWYFHVDDNFILIFMWMTSLFFLISTMKNKNNSVDLLLYLQIYYCMFKSAIVHPSLPQYKLTLLCQI